MRKKRFTYLDASKNKYIGSFFCNSVPLTNDEVVDLLNENEQLKQTLKYFVDITTLTKAIELLDKVYDKYLYASPSDTIAEAKRKGIKECMDTLENYLEDLDV